MKVKADPQPYSDTDSQGTDQGVNQNESDRNYMDSKTKETDFKRPKKTRNKQVKEKVKSKPLPESDTDS